MRRRRLLTIAVPDPLGPDEADAISAAVQDARRHGAPLVLGGDVQLRTHDLGPRAQSGDVEQSLLRRRARVIHARADRARSSRYEARRAARRRERAEAFMGRRAAAVLG